MLGKHYWYDEDPRTLFKTTPQLSLGYVLRTIEFCVLKASSPAAEDEKKGGRKWKGEANK